MTLHKLGPFERSEIPKAPCVIALKHLPTGKIYICGTINARDAARTWWFRLKGDVGSALPPEVRSIVEQAGASPSQRHDARDSWRLAVLETDALFAEGELLVQAVQAMLARAIAKAPELVLNAGEYAPVRKRPKPIPDLKPANDGGALVGVGSPLVDWDNYLRRAKRASRRPAPSDEEIRLLFQHWQDARSFEALKRRT